MTDLTSLLADMRPRLHRYCARMVGSVIDGEDVVQETLAKAAEAFAKAGPLERPEAWLLRIAHTTALDALRRSRRQAALYAGAELDEFEDTRSEADARVAATSSLACLMQLPPAQRSSVVLMDVLGHSLAETASIIDLTVPAVKAALHRGRARLRTAEDSDAGPALDAQERARLREYADRFNARDFDALRALLAEDVRLDLVARVRMSGRDVAVYFTRYEEARPWRLEPGVVDGVPALLAYDPDSDALTFFIVLTWRDGRIASIRDFHYAPYVVEPLMQDKRRIL